MIKIENVNVYGWEPAIRGMRNPMNSWEKSDSCECSIEEMEYSKCLTSCTESEIPEKCKNCKGVYLGKNDLKLMQSLSKAGTDHSKFLRMIVVTMDITARNSGGRKLTLTKSVLSETHAVKCTVLI